MLSSSIDSPNINFAIQKSQCDSYIRWFETKVKKKMKVPATFRPSRSASKRPEHEVYEMFLAKKLFRAPKHGLSTTLTLDPPPPGAIVSVQMKRILSVAVAAGILLSGCGGRKRTRLPVAARVGATETGTASWYGRPYHGRRAANGEIYDMEKMTAAHRTLPFGTCSK